MLQASWSAPAPNNGGIIKDGAKMVNAVANSVVPKSP
jgi:acetyl-CoA carboxylase carboxyltransferase component